MIRELRYTVKVYTNKERRDQNSQLYSVREEVTASSEAQALEIVTDSLASKKRTQDEWLADLQKRTGGLPSFIGVPSSTEFSRVYLSKVIITLEEGESWT